LATRVRESSVAGSTCLPKTVPEH